MAMSAAQQPPTTPAASAPPCPSCGSPLAPDQRYCLACGTRVGEPRAAPVRSSPPPQSPSAAPASRQSDVSPLAAVIGVALLGGMLLIGVLIGRGTNNDAPPAPVVQVGGGAATTGGPTEAPTAVASEWPEGTDGFTIQLSTLPKQGATAESVDAAKQAAVTSGAADAAVLDSDLYSSLPPGNYVIYSGVYTDRKSAEVALKGLAKSFPPATVVEVSAGASQSQSSESSQPGDVPPVGAAGGESEAPPAGAPK